MRDLPLVGSVVIHHPDFFVPAAAADKKNLAFCNAGNTPAETEDDLVGELMRRVRAASSVAASVYCLPSTCGEVTFFTL